MGFVPPGLIVALLLILICSQLIYAFLPQRPRPYVVVLGLTVLGWILGQVWLGLGLPAWRIGQADVLPAALFALALQPLAPHVPWPPINLRGDSRPPR
ncbi:MAG TPA: hypothetical protein VF137_12685 [Candidatus Dormibacteraeota bacterium]